MRELSELEALIYSDGERLIPGVTHDRAEEVRHRSSYAFWSAIIELASRVAMGCRAWPDRSGFPYLRGAATTLRSEAVAPPSTRCRLG